MSSHKQCHLEVERVKRPSSLKNWFFFSSKSFNHIAKDASILHLKLGGSHRLKITSQLPPLQNTPLITTVDLLQAVDF
jgi:hypothetical protein